MSEQNVITNIEQGVAFLKECAKTKDVVDKDGKIIGASIKIEKSDSDKFLKQAGAPEAMIKTVSEAHNLLTNSLYKLTADKTIEVTKEVVKNKNIEPEKVRVKSKVIIGSDHETIQLGPISHGKNPTNGEPVTSYGCGRMKIDISRRISDADVELFTNECKKLLSK